MVNKPKCVNECVKQSTKPVASTNKSVIERLENRVSESGENSVDVTFVASTPAKKKHRDGNTSNQTGKLHEDESITQ